MQWKTAAHWLELLRDVIRPKRAPKLEAGQRLREWKDFPEPLTRWTLNRVWVVFLV
jgi:hypothetical protein